MPGHSQLLGLAAPLAVLIAAAVVLPATARANHEHRYFGFGYQPYVAPQYPPVIYPPPPRVRERAPGVFEYEVAPGRWVRMRTGPGYVPPRHSVRTPPPSQAARPEPARPPVPQRKPEPAEEPSVAARDAPTIITLEPVREDPLRDEPVREEPAQQQAAPQAPEQTPQEQAQEQEQAAARALEPAETGAGDRLSCDAAAGIVETFGFSDVESTSCSGDEYGFDATRDGSSYSIGVSAANGELTKVHRR